jgi:hypothetical protein
MFIAMDGDIDDAYIPDAAATLDPHVPFCDRWPRMALRFDRWGRLSEKIDRNRPLIVARDLDVIEPIQTRGTDAFASLFSDADLVRFHFALLVRPIV